MEYDVIGDIHGQAGKLDSMLQKLGYAAKGDGRRFVFELHHVW